MNKDYILDDKKANRRQTAYRRRMKDANNVELEIDTILERNITDAITDDSAKRVLLNAAHKINRREGRY